MEPTEEFKKYEKQTIAIRISAIVLAVLLCGAAVAFFVLGIIEISGSDKPSLWLAGPIFCLGLIFLAVFPLNNVAMRRKAIIKLYNSYSKVLARNPRNAVDELHEALSVPSEKIVENFVRLNDLGFFEKIFIDEANLVVNTSGGDDEKTEYVCPKCGGTTLIDADGEIKCAFCGAIQERNDNKERSEDNEL